MRLSFIVAYLCFFISLVEMKCMDLETDPPSPAEPKKQELNVCTWYNDATCCTPGKGVDSVDHHSAPCPLSSDCADQSNLLACMFCSPDYLSYTVDEDRGAFSPRICSSFANKWYDACKDDMMLMEDDETCKRIGDVIGSAKEYLERIGSIYYEEGDELCFNSASLVAPLGAFLSLLIFGFVF